MVLSKMILGGCKKYCGFSKTVIFMNWARLLNKEVFEKPLFNLTFFINDVI